MQVAGFSDAENPDNVHIGQANVCSLFIGPCFAKTVTAYITQLQELESKGEVEQLQCARKTVDGRSVVDMGACTDPTDIFAKGKPSFKFTPFACKLVLCVYLSCV